MTFQIQVLTMQTALLMKQKKITSKSIVEIPSEHVIQSQWIPKAHAIFTDVSDNWANKGISICKYYG